MDELLEELMEDLPEDRDGAERRKHSLTRDDLRVIALLVKHSQHCNMGLTTDEVTTLKRFLDAFNTAASLAGKVIVTSVVVGFISFMAWAVSHKILELKK